MAWKLLNLDSTETNYGIKMVFDRIDTLHADLCFSTTTITQRVS